MSLLSADQKAYKTDPAMRVPECVKQYTYDGTTLYEKLSMRKNSAGAAAGGQSASKARTSGLTRRMVRGLKNAVLSLYGVHGIYSKFIRNAKRFRSEEFFDIVISLSTPPSSHLLAHELIRSGHIRCNKWIQIWEDPWYSDAYGFNNKKKIYDEENRLLSFAESICYVSPITLEYQKKLFPVAADKMFWQPRPAYYEGGDHEQNHSMVFGYFGDYQPAARNLAPFYAAAKETGIQVRICGNPSSLFQATDRIRIYPRLPLDKLHPIEEEAGVLVFLCNRKGGQIPGKIYQYAATTKTILFILDGTDEEKRILREYFEPFQRFVFCENKEDDIVAAIGRIQRGEISDVSNEPLDNFQPAEIIRRILTEC